MDMERFLLRDFVDFTEFSNFRDVGGQNIASRVSVPQGLIYRSAHLDNLTSEGIKKLLSLRIQSVFDLRSNKEIANQFNDRGGISWAALSDAPKYYHVAIPPISDLPPENYAAHLEAWSKEGTEGGVNWYRTLILAAGEAMQAILSQLTDEDTFRQPLLIHCRAGKGRTGIVVMMLLMLAGCSTDDIAAEYHLSDLGLGEEYMVSRIAKLKMNPIFERMKPEELERMASARKDVMCAVVDMVRSDFGGIENLLTQRLGIDPSVVEAGKKALRDRSPGITNQ